MLHNIWNNMKNPFIIYGYDSPEYFCDRIDETQRLMNAAENGRNIVLASVRRLGKSVLVKHVQNNMKKNRDFVPVYIDIMPTTDLASFTRVLAKGVFEQSAGLTLKSLAVIKSWLTRITPSLTIDTTTNLPSLELKVTPDAAIGTIEDVFRYIRSTDKQFHICIDEFQQIAGFPEKNIEAILRSHIQNLSNAHFIFSGSKQHLLTSMFFDYSRPFYQSSELFELKKIEETKYIEFIISQFGKGNQDISDTLSKEILNKTRTHTYYVQYLCNRLFEQKHKTIKSSDIEKTINQISNETEFLYQNYRNLLTNNQWDLLKAIAGEGAVSEPTSAEFIRNYNLSSTSSVSLALKSLIEKELVYSDNDSYLVSDLFFSNWLKNL